MPLKSGYVAIVGRPNAGKSTLVNKLVGSKVAIVSPKPQTTRNRIQGIVNRDDAQIVLVDTPGIHRPENVLSRQMMDELQHALEGIEVLSLIVDASSTDFGPGDRFSIEWVRRFHGPVFLLLNKVDTVNKPLLLPLIDRYRQAYDFAEIFPISALTGDGCDDLVNAWIARLPEAPPLFPPDQFTDQPERFLAAELIREQAILATREEVPHALAVLVDTFEEKRELIKIRATLYVEREGQKGILIGTRRRHDEKNRHRRAQGNRNSARRARFSGIIGEGAAELAPERRAGPPTRLAAPARAARRRAKFLVAGCGTVAKRPQRASRHALRSAIRTPEALRLPVPARS